MFTAATPVGASKSNVGFSMHEDPYDKVLETEAVIVLTKCDFPVLAPPVMNKFNGGLSTGCSADKF